MTEALPVSPPNFRLRLACIGRGHCCPLCSATRTVLRTFPGCKRERSLLRTVPILLKIRSVAAELGTTLRIRIASCTGPVRPLEEPVVEFRRHRSTRLTSCFYKISYYEFTPFKFVKLTSFAARVLISLSTTDPSDHSPRR